MSRGFRGISSAAAAAAVFHDLLTFLPLPGTVKRDRGQMNSGLGQVRRQSTGGAVGCLFFCFGLAFIPIFLFGFRGKPLKLFASHGASFPAPVSTSIIQQTLDFVNSLLYNRKQKRRKNHHDNAKTNQHGAGVRRNEPSGNGAPDRDDAIEFQPEIQARDLHGGRTATDRESARMQIPKQIHLPGRNRNRRITKKGTAKERLPNTADNRIAKHKTCQKAPERPQKALHRPHGSDHHLPRHRAPRACERP